MVLVTGGCRSGKSAYAQRLAESLPSPRLFVATCPVTDEEMRLRIEMHQQSRLGRGWETVEEQVELITVFRRYGEYEVVLVDCLTLWVNNLMYYAEQAGRPSRERNTAETCRELLAAARQRRGTVIFVTNEVGLGVVPDNAMARRYRDLVGRVNQTIAAEADTVTLLTCGIPWHLKST
ncbi:MAG: bifunctional adenosylcobinamide kinase/adenosylcobinamide-phosphate guanylyltransferase [Planctomycetota bacterium]|nr:bifunctional adenosylcobinamide kinase/adenosylcobinamide-phosphate guanylyltransferase [Planctomycetota bacterium]